MEDQADQQGRQDEPSVAEVLATASRAGLVISDEDALRLVAGARRVRAMAAEVRELASPETEPSGPAVHPWPARPR